MSGIKNLAGQTIWYGASTIAARFISYLLTPYLTGGVLLVANYGEMSLVYAAIPLLNVLFTYGFETAYFRFVQRREHEKDIYSTASLSLMLSTVLFFIVMWLFNQTLANWAGLGTNPLLIKLSIIVIAFDTLSAIPFARLRQQGRPVKFALIRVAGILINVALTVFFLSWCPKLLEQNPSHWVGYFYHSNVDPVTYIILANVVQSVFTLLLLLKEIGEVQLKFDSKLWKAMMLYSLPLVIAGMGGMINETFDRLMLNWLVPGSQVFKNEQVGIYSACYKLSILITLFIQAFRMGAEPFFFKQAEGGNPQRTYARVMKFFVITVTTMFLVVALFLPLWKYFVGPKFWGGLVVVPILLLANIFLGIYYNLSIWYKLGNKTRAGAWLTLIGAVITLTVNWFFIPRYSYIACAWATFFCYGTMMVFSYIWGQKEYRIPYATKKLVAYMVIVVVLFFIHRAIGYLLPNIYVSVVTATALLAVYAAFLLLVERKEFQRLPVVGRFVK